MKSPKIKGRPRLNKPKTTVLRAYPKDKKRIRELAKKLGLVEPGDADHDLLSKVLKYLEKVLK